MRRGVWMVLAPVILVLTGCAAAVEDPTEPLTGSEVAVAKNCVSCHTTSGARSVGPTWRFLFGSDVELEDGSMVAADEDYLVRSMREPQFDVVAGFTTVAMPSIELTDAEVMALVSYIESLGRSGSFG